MTREVRRRLLSALPTDVTVSADGKIVVPPVEEAAAPEVQPRPPTRDSAPRPPRGTPQPRRVSAPQPQPVDRAGRPARRRPPEAEPVSPEVERLGQQVRRMYFLCRSELSADTLQESRHVPAWDGGVDAFGVNRANLWPRIARNMLAWGVDPFVFVRSQFLGRVTPPQPNEMIGANALACYNRVASTEVNLIQKFRADANAILQSILGSKAAFGWDSARSTRFALLDTFDVQASALFRYLLAKKEGFTDIAAKFERAAVTEYSFRKNAYDSCASWAAMIGKDLQDAAALYRSQVLSGL